MKRIILSLLSLLTVGQIAAFASSDDFNFENDTTHSVYHLYVSPHSAGRWGRDILGRDVLNPEQNTDVYWTDEPNTDVFDIRIDYQNGNFVEFTEGYDLSTISRVWITNSGRNTTLHWN